MKKQYNTLLFDVDGTLLDFDVAEQQGLAAVLESQGIKSTPELQEQYRKINNKYWKSYERGEISKDQIMGNRFREFFKGIGMEIDGNEVEIFYRSQLDSSAVLIEGALEICQYLKPHYRMYIVTNGVSGTQYTRLAKSGLDQYFEDIFVSEDAGSQKPQKEYFDYCFARMPEADPGKMMIIGDSLTSDIKGGNIAGIDTCWYNPDHHSRMAGIHVDYQIKELRELKELL